MESIYLLKYGELSLKGANRFRFEKLLCTNIKKKLDGLDFELIRKQGRIYLRAGEKDHSQIVNALSKTFGLVAFSEALKVDKDMSKIEEAAICLAQKLLHKSREDSSPIKDNNLPCSQTSYKIEARRSDKSFPLNSYEIACRLGNVLCSHFQELKVNLNRPDWIINVEVRDAAYLYGPLTRAPGGLPLGCSGKGLLLLSGGIDSPVAGYFMGKRGLNIHAVYFHTPPFTSEKAREKVEHLADILSAYLTGIALHVVPFTEIQARIKERSKNKEITLLMRACMMRISGIIARNTGSICLITGESLGQVASQTTESLRFTGSMADMLVFRPLIGLDKEEIIRWAKKIETFETSILPFEDCCTLFTPPHPLINPNYERMVQAFNDLQADELIAGAVQDTRVIQF